MRVPLRRYEKSPSLLIPDNSYQLKLLHLPVAHILLSISVSWSSKRIKRCGDAQIRTEDLYGFGKREASNLTDITHNLDRYGYFLVISPRAPEFLLYADWSDPSVVNCIFLCPQRSVLNTALRRRSIAGEKCETVNDMLMGAMVAKYAWKAAGRLDAYLVVRSGVGKNEMPAMLVTRQELQQ